MELTALTTPPTPVAGSEPKNRKRATLAIAFSVGIHLVMAALFLLSDFHFDKTVDLNKNIIQTRLVKLGKERKKEWLPRKAKPKPKPKAKKKSKPASPKKTVAQPKAEKPAPKPKEAEAKKPVQEPDRQKEMSDALSKLQAIQASDLNRLIDDTLATEKEEDEGQAYGSSMGTEVSGEMQASYNALLSAQIREAFELPAVLTDAERMHLRAQLAIRIGPNGELLSAKVTQSSGNPSFDNAVLTAVQKSVPLPNPPLVLRALYRKGVTLEFIP